MKPVEKELGKFNIEADVFGRAKHYYSIFRKKLGLIFFLLQKFLIK